MEEVAEYREANQPIKERTGGSTFKNPPGSSAWKLIDAAGCRGLRVGGAKVSEMHCNFLINDRNATAEDIERLGETVRARVRATSGVTLQWEIIRLGDAAAGPADRRGAGRGDARHERSRRRRASSDHVAVLMGGLSAEREVSLNSGEACAEALESAGYKVTRIDAGRDLAQRLAEVEARRLLQRAARPLGRGRLRAGPAGAARHPLHPLRRAGLGAGHAQGARQGGRCMRAGVPVADGARRAPRGGGQRRTCWRGPTCSSRSPKAPASASFIVREDHTHPPQELQRSRLGVRRELLAERYIPGRELTCARDGRARRSASPRSCRPETLALLQLRGQVRGRRLAPHAAGAGFIECLRIGAEVNVDGS